jgi:hypothetical protein
LAEIGAQRAVRAVGVSHGRDARTPHRRT